MPREHGAWQAQSWHFPALWSTSIPPGDSQGSFPSGLSGRGRRTLCFQLVPNTQQTKPSLIKH